MVWLSSYVSDNIAAVGALMLGIAAVGSFFITLHQARQRASDECERRIADLREAFEAGTRYERRDRKPH